MHKLVTLSHAISQRREVDGKVFLITDTSPIYFWDMIWKAAVSCLKYGLFSER